MEKRRLKKAGRIPLLSAVFISVLLFGMCPDADADADKNEKEEQLVRFAGYAGAGGAFLIMTTLFAQDIWFKPYEPNNELFVEDAETWKKVAVAVPTIAVSTAVSWWSMRKFTELYTEWEVRKVWSVPVGMACGAAVGAVIGAVGFATCIGTGAALDIVDTGTIEPYAAVLGMSVIAGGFWGALYGIIPGLVIGPGISFYMDY